jgi:hypothetical protein
MYNQIDDATVFISLAEDTKYVEIVWSRPGKIKTTYKSPNIYDIDFLEKSIAALQKWSARVPTISRALRSGNGTRLRTHRNILRGRAAE